MEAVLTTGMAKHRPGYFKKQTAAFVFAVLAVLLIFIGIFPLLWMYIAGFKPKTEIVATPFRFFPHVWTFDNYGQLLGGRPDSYLFPRGANFLRSIGVTFLVSGTAVLLSLFINSMAAYAFARLRFPFKRILWPYYLVTMFVPSISILIPCSQVVTAIGLGNNVLALILPGVVYVWSVFFYRQFYLNVPRSLEEAALIDGCGRLKIFFRIFMPMSMTPYVIMGISVFQGFWNSFIWPTIVMRDPLFMQVNQLIAYFRSAQEIQWNMLMASSAIASLPLIILLVIFQKNIMQGIKISGLK
ncbi:sn-glycerol-3-phosphate transport system permease protein UgpE [Spirochaetia bacterium]|nr:sn-glycerol-3-phosphate transport system permease protein UgpE [Spirochaetia bacterium]